VWSIHEIELKKILSQTENQLIYPVYSDIMTPSGADYIDPIYLYNGLNYLYQRKLKGTKLVA